METKLKQLGLFVFATVLCLTLQAQEADFSKAFTDSGGYKEKAMKKAPRRVFIRDFSVYFQVLAAAQDNSDGGGYRSTVVGATRTTMGVGLNGVSLEELQAITDKLYKEYTDRLTSEGFTFVSADEASKTEVLSDWTQFDGGGEPSTAQVGGYLAFTPNGGKFFYRKMTASGKTKGSVLIDNAYKISGQLDDAIVASVSLVVPFVYLEAGTAIKLAQMGSKVKGKTNLVLATSASEQEVKTGLIANLQRPEVVSTCVMYTSGNGPGASADSYVYHGLKKDVEIPGVIDKQKIVERTDADVTSAYQSNSYNLAGALMVSVEDRESKTSHIVTVDGPTYEKQVFGAMDKFLDTSLDQFLEVAK